MGNLGDRSSKLLLDSGSVLKIGDLVARFTYPILQPKYIGVNVCKYSFLMVYHLFCDCVLLLRLLHPFMDRVLSEAQNNNCCCRGKYVSVEHNLNTHFDCVQRFKLVVQRDYAPICIYICI